MTGGIVISPQGYFNHTGQSDLAGELCYLLHETVKVWFFANALKNSVVTFPGWHWIYSMLVPQVTTIASCG